MNMTKAQILENLCYYDERNPNNVIDEWEDEDERQQPMGNGCACDNCFYGRSVMAKELLKIRQDVQFY